VETARQEKTVLVTGDPELLRLFRREAIETPMGRDEATALTTAHAKSIEPDASVPREIIAGAPS
jgi:hypothetical protein